MTNISIGEKTRSSLYWNIILKIPSEIIRFIISIIVARILEPRDFGIVSIATLLIYYSNSITNFGFNQALIQRNDITEKHINSVFTVDLFISLFMMVTFFFLAPPIAVFFHSPESINVIRVMSLIFVLTTFFDIPYTLLRRDINFKQISIIDLAKDLSASLVTLILALIGYGYWSIIFGQLITLFAVSTYMIILSSWKPKIAINILSLKELFNFGIWSFIRAQLYFFHTRVDRIIIGRYLNTSLLGIYDKSKSITQIPNETIASNINTVLFSSFSRLQNDKNNLKRIFKRSITITSLINFPIFIGLGFIARHFVLLFLGNKWIEMILPMQIMCASGFISSFAGLIIACIVGAGNYQKYTVWLMISTIFLVLISLYSVEYGIEAVAFGVLIYISLQLIVGLIFAKNILYFTYKEILYCAFPALIGCAIMGININIFMHLLFKDITFTNIFWIITIGLISYAISIFFIPTDEMREIKVSIYSDIKNAIYNR